MPKSKARKGHKKKVQARRQERILENKRREKKIQEYIETLQQEHASAKKLENQAYTQIANESRASELAISEEIPADFATTNALTNALNAEL